MSADHDKEALRKVARAKRQQAFRDHGTPSSQGLARHLMRVLENQSASTLAGYWAVGSELSLEPVLNDMADEGWKVALPVVVEAGKPLMFRRWLPGDPLIQGPLKTLQPQTNCEKLTPEIVLVPLLAFDDEKNRLGQGAGFYDRTLAVLREQNGGVLAIGVGFASQQVESVPFDHYDQRLDIIVTENGVL